MVAEDASVSATLSVRSSSVDVRTDTNTRRISTDANHVNVFQVDNLVTLRQIQPYMYLLPFTFQGWLTNKYWKSATFCKLFTVSVCGPVCQKYCKHGMVMDEYGCPICQCWEPHPCEVAKFFKYCIFSATYIYIKVHMIWYGLSSQIWVLFSINCDALLVGEKLQCHKGYILCNSDGRGQFRRNQTRSSVFACL